MHVQWRSGLIGTRHGESSSLLRDCAYLHVLETVLLTDASKYILFTAFLHFACKEQLVEYEVGLLEVEYYVQFANVSIVLVHLFHVAVDNLKRDELIVG